MVFAFSSLNKLCLCLLTYVVFDEESAVNLIEGPSYVISQFSLTAFKMLSFNSILIMCLIWLSFIFITLGVH